MLGLGLYLGRSFHCIAAPRPDGRAQVMLNAVNEDLTLNAVAWQEGRWILGSQATSLRRRQPNSVEVDPLGRIMAGQAVELDGQRLEAEGFLSLALEQAAGSLEHRLAVRPQAVALALSPEIWPALGSASLAAAGNANLKLAGAWPTSLAEAATLWAPSAVAGSALYLHLHEGRQAVHVHLVRADRGQLCLLAERSYPAAGQEAMHQALVEWALQEVSQDHGVDGRSQPRFLESLWATAAGAVSDLERYGSGCLVVMGGLAGQDGEILDLELDLDLTQYRRLARPKFEAVLDDLPGLLAQAGDSPQSPSRIGICFAGPDANLWREMLAERFGPDSLTPPSNQGENGALAAATLLSSCPWSISLQPLPAAGPAQGASAQAPVPLEPTDEEPLPTLAESEPLLAAPPQAEPVAAGEPEPEPVAPPPLAQEPTPPENEREPQEPAQEPAPAPPAAEEDAAQAEPQPLAAVPPQAEPVAAGEPQPMPVAPPPVAEEPAAVDPEAETLKSGLSPQPRPPAQEPQAPPADSSQAPTRPASPPAPPPPPAAPARQAPGPRVPITPPQPLSRPVREVVADRYQILETKAKESHSTRYLAKDEQGDARVLLKYYPAGKESAKQAFARALTVRLIRHPNLDAILDFGPHGKGMFLVLADEQRLTVRELLRRQGSGTPLPLPTALRIMVGLGEALRAIHLISLSHRNVKPENIRVQEQGGGVWLGGFDICQFTPAGVRVKTVAGTPYYMAPESWLGQPGCASDIFSAAVLFYEMTTGSLPFSGQTADELSQAIRTQEPVPPKQLNPSLPQGINDIILRGLAKDPAWRILAWPDISAALE